MNRGHSISFLCDLACPTLVSYDFNVSLAFLLLEIKPPLVEQGAPVHFSMHRSI